MATKSKNSKWLPTLNIPEAKSGEFSIEHVVHKKGEPVMMNTMRVSMFRSSKYPQNIFFDQETRFHLLKGPGGGVITSDLPIEQWQQFEEVKGLKGHILVGGLGVGMIAKHLAAKKTVKAVTVVEINKDVIKLVEPYIRDPKITVVHADLFQYLKDAKHPFSAAFYDIWTSDGESTFFKTVCPLRELSQGVVRGEIRCWNESVMRGQLVSSIHSKRSRIIFHQLASAQEKIEGVEDREQVAKILSEELSNKPKWKAPDLDKELEPNAFGENYDVIFHNWSVPFFQWVEQEKPDDDRLTKASQYYAGLYCACPDWLDRWNYLIAEGRI